jgi:hypothetical protein
MAKLLTKMLKKRKTQIRKETKKGQQKRKNKIKLQLRKSGRKRATHWRKLSVRNDKLK